jgi:arsenate reductase-like glutaredoxin family protein
MYSDDWWLTRLVQEPLMLRQPLVRYASRVSVGLDETSWKQWLEA